MTRRAWILALSLLVLIMAVIAVAICRGPIVFDAGRGRESWAKEHVCYTAIVLARTDFEIREFIRRTGHPPIRLEDVGGEEVKDGWGNPLYFERRPDNSYELKSPGPDHQVGTADDQSPEETWPRSPKQCQKNG
jgi:hypothetical protein